MESGARRPGSGDRPAHRCLSLSSGHILTLADRLLATPLHYRLALPQVAVAALFIVHPGTINRRIREIRQLLDTAGHTIHPADPQLATLDDLYDFASTAGITPSGETKPASK
ncbi:transposase family protein [Streptomyces laculatispora]|uniref:transposase family protein n=1 Tax=Streptomyces laculatispora TaxID=887464 RepID=UPI0035199360